MNPDLQLPRLSAAVPQQTYPYESSIASSASSSSSSVFSADGASSHSSDSTSHSIYLNKESGHAYHVRHQAPMRQGTNGKTCARRALPPLCTNVSAPTQQRQHPRRSSSATSHAPPPLVRQCERKVNFVESLLDSATQIVEVIWPLSVPSCSEGPNGRGVLPLRIFIGETLRRSRTSYSTLQVALYYLILIKPRVPKHDFTMEQPEDMHSLRALQCGRRMFLAALMLASKYLQDRNYSARAWSKISGLGVDEINTNEMAFLEAVAWKLHIVDPIFERWREIVLHYTPSHQPPPSPRSPATMALAEWKSIIPSLTPELDNVPLPPQTPVTLCPPEPGFPRGSPASLPDVSAPEMPATPHKLPRFLEPKTDLIPPTPSVPRMGPLPTPQMTPQPLASVTPAAGAMAFGMRRPSMCAAMAQAQSACMARTAMDMWNPTLKPNGLEGYQVCGRRPSYAPSLSSSPESMVSDNSSRSSRASSISSVSSATWAPNAAKLARLATCRNAKLSHPVAQQYCPKEAALAEQPCHVTSEPASSPDFDNFRLSDAETLVQLPLPVRSKPNSFAEPSKKPSSGQSPSRSRKRGRSSVDLSLQQNVRGLLHTSQSCAQLRRPANHPATQTVLPDRSAARSFLLSRPDDRTPASLGMPKALQSPTAMPDGRLPVQKDLGRKRACCASEAVLGMRKPGPGMWEGIL